MKFSGNAFSIEVVEEGVYKINFDLQGAPVNVFNDRVFAELSQILDQLEQQAVLKGCVFTSGKSVFVAGADIPTLLEKTSVKTSEFIHYAHAIFDRIQSLPCITIAAINGFALGGGLEYALAMDVRIIAKDAKVGLPEVNLGIFPGWGGTVRLPRIIKPELAAQWIATGGHQSAEAALQAGLVTAIVDSPEKLLDAALLEIKELQIKKLKIEQQQDNIVAIRHTKTQPINLSDDARSAIDDLLANLKTQPDYPAATKAIECLLAHAPLSAEEANYVEIVRFVELLKTDTAQNLLSVFVNEQATARVAKGYARQTEKIKSAAVIGAGVMGGGIAYQSALKKIPVVMKDIRQQALDLGVNEANRNFDILIKKGRLDEAAKQQAMQRITPTLDSPALKQADVIVEAVVENIDVKQAVLSDLEQHIRADAILASNTSTISITRLAKSLKRPAQFCGIHFFNPVPLMPLVEIIRGEQTSEATIAKAVSYALQLGKKPIVVNDCPAFLVNRVLFPYLNAAHTLINEGVDFQQLDQVMERFGWPMGPALLSDVVGIDTVCRCLNVLADDIPERMAMSFKSSAQRLLENDRLGQKNKAGYYQFVKDKQGRLRKQVDLGVYPLLYSDVTKEVSAQEIEQRLMIAVCLEMVRCLEEGIVDSPAQADMAMLWGLGFPRFRGGLLRYIDTIGIDEFCLQAEKYESLGAMYRLPALLKQNRLSKTAFY